MQTHLSNTQQQALQEIRDSSYDKLLTGRDSNGVPFLKSIFELHLKIFGEVCSFCPAKITGYIKKLKDYNLTSKKLEIMAEAQEKNFVLKPGIIIPIPGTSESYSNDNLTNEIALAYVAINPNRRSIFSTVPSDLDIQLKKLNDTKDIEILDNDDSNDNLVYVANLGREDGQNRIDVPSAVAIIKDAIGINTKAKSVAGVETVIASFGKDQSHKFRGEVNAYLDNLAAAKDFAEPVKK